MPTPRVGLPQDASKLEASTRHITDPSVRKTIVARHVEKHIPGNVQSASVHWAGYLGAACDIGTAHGDTSRGASAEIRKVS